MGAVSDFHTRPVRLLTANLAAFEMKDNCGICLTTISNRGVLDCCDDLFCFSCIDGWAAITNQCPKCKAVFKLITFLPVEGEDFYLHESTDSQNATEEREGMFDSFEEDLPLTFPSYYIDEEAIECLEGGECLVRCGKTGFDSWDDLSDTSVACDSCERWYHANCVEFSPGDFEGAWFCPRCSSKTSSWRYASLESNMEAKALSPIQGSCFRNVIPETMKMYSEEGVELPVTIEMPELGETAIVVSMLAANINQEDRFTEEEAVLSSRNNLQHQPAVSGNNFKSNIVHNSVRQALDEVAVESKDCHEGQNHKVDSSLQTEGCSFSFETKDQTRCGNAVPHRSELVTYCSIPNLQASGVISSSFSDDFSVERKRKLEFQSPEINSSIMEIVSGDDFPTLKKSNHGQASRRVSHLPLPNNSLQKHEAAEIADPCYAASFPGAVESTKVLDKEYGVRMRKIMWRADDSKGKTSSLVEEVRQKMRVEAGYGAVPELGLIDISDDKFLSAFKSALAKTSQKAKHTLRCRKPGPLKGGIRESLTKKLYGGGRGRRVWDRDWDISFWGRRGNHMRRSPKDTTSRRALNSSEFNEELAHFVLSLKDDRESESLLGRLYVADASLLPRADNIQSVSEKLKGEASDLQKPRISQGTVMASQNNWQSSNQSSTRLDSRVTSSKLSCHSHFPQKLTSTQSEDATAKTAISAGTKVGLKVNKVTSSTTSMKDKREWALEVLARKKGEASFPNVHGKDGGSSSGKVLFRYLAQLPYDMRPVVEHDPRSKISTAVRQAQLNRLVDDQLKRANLLSIGVNQESRVVIAEAVMKEQEIYDRSNSKIVYLNLCVQSLKQMSLAKKLENTVSKVSETDISDAVNVALVATGLISDSPPGSPQSVTSLRVCESNCLEIDQNLFDQGRDQPFHAFPFSEAVDQSLEIYQDIEFEFDVCEPSWQEFQERKNPFDIHRTPNPKDARLKVFLSSANDAKPAISSSSVEKPSECSAITTTLDTCVASDDQPKTDKDVLMDPTYPSTLGGGVNVEHYPSIMMNGISSALTQPSTLDKDVNTAQDVNAAQDWWDMENDISTELITESTSVKDDTPQVPGLMETEISTESAPETILCNNSFQSGDIHSRMPDTECTLLYDKPVCLPNRCSEAFSICGNIDQETMIVTSPEEILEVNDASQSVCCIDVNIVKHENLDERTVLEVDKTAPIHSHEDIVEGQVSPLNIDGYVGDQLCQSNTLVSCCEKDPSSQPLSDHKEAMPLLQQNLAAESQQIADLSVNQLETAQVRKGLQPLVQKKVEMYIKEHIRPLCKSGVVTVEQYRWALMKTAKKVLQHHHESTSADFLITEGCKVKKLAEQYLQLFVKRNTAAP